MLTYPAAPHISCGEWIFFGALLLSFALGGALIAWVLVDVIRRLVGA